MRGGRALLLLLNADFLQMLIVDRGGNMDTGMLACCQAARRRTCGRPSVCLILFLFTFMPWLAGDAYGVGGEPVLSCPTHPNPSVEYISRDVVFTWSEPEGETVGAYPRWFYAFDDQPDAVVTALSLSTDLREVTFFNVPLGQHYFHLRGRDAQGQLSDTVHFSVRIIPNGLQITNVSSYFSAPYLLDFNFSLRDADNHAVVAPSSFIDFICRENGVPISPFETKATLIVGAHKEMKCFLVLDYSNSMFASGAVSTMQEAAKGLIDSLTTATQFGLYEFHREDQDPQRVSGLSTNKAYLKSRIDAIEEEYVQGFPAASRCWDALYAGVMEFPIEISGDEQRFVICLSDGRDESSLMRARDSIEAAKERKVRIYCIGFGDDPNRETLERITEETGGQYYGADHLDALSESFEQISNDLQGQYTLRWATLKRYESDTFTPSFTISVGDSDTYTADEKYNPEDYAGDVLGGRLRFTGSTVVDGETDLYLRAVYVPRYITRLRLYVNTPFEFTASLTPRSDAGLCEGWTLTSSTQVGDPDAVWIEISSPDLLDPSTAMPFGAFGNVIKLHFRHLGDLEQLFDRFAFHSFVDNSIYEANQHFSMDFFKGSEIASGVAEEMLDYRIFYSDCRLEMAGGGRIVATEHLGKTASIKIVQRSVPDRIEMSDGMGQDTVPGVQYLRTFLIPTLEIEGDVNKVYTEAPIKTLRVEGHIRSLTARNCHVENVEAATLGQVKMTGRKNSLVGPVRYWARTRLSAEDWGGGSVKVSLMGVVAEDLYFPLQTLGTLKIAARKWREKKGSGVFVSESGLFGGDVDVLEVRKIRASGASLIPDSFVAWRPSSLLQMSPRSSRMSAKGGVFTTGSSKQERAVVPIPADFKGKWYLLTSKLDLRVKGGDIGPEILYVSDNIGDLRSNWLKYRDDDHSWQRIGGRIGFPYTCIAAGGGREPREKADIGSIMGALGVAGDFYAGVHFAEQSVVFGPGFEPSASYLGSIGSIKTKKISRFWPNDLDALILGRAFVRQAKRLRAQLNDGLNAENFVVIDPTTP